MKTVLPNPGQLLAPSFLSSLVWPFAAGSLAIKGNSTPAAIEHFSPVERLAASSGLSFITVAAVATATPPEGSGESGSFIWGAGPLVYL